VRCAIAAAALAVAVLLTACGGGGGEKSTSTAAPKPAESPPAKQPPTDVAPGGGLAIGLTEINPDLFWHGKDVGEFDAWRDRVEALKPQVYRLTVDWATLQPSADAPIDWTKASDGCMRGLEPCRPYRGIRDTLRAIRSQQQAGNGFATMVVFYGVPDWAAIKPTGCERDDIGARSRPITAQGLDAYKRLVRSLQDLARRQGVAIRWWSPWNEPNGPFFISPQRAKCRGSSKSLSPAVYAKLARAMRAELRPGQQLMVGELAGLEDARKYGTSISEFFEALPDDKPIWITETGVGGPHVGDERSPKDESIRADCQALNVALRRWDKDPRVDAAIQYTFRDDPIFPVGLADAKLDKEWPAYQLFKAWGGARNPDAPPPALPKACSA
jgi:hypothetical protein